MTLRAVALVLCSLIFYYGSVANAYRCTCIGKVCPDVPTGCELTFDDCNCCLICAIKEGERCSSRWRKCESGLTCVSDWSHIGSYNRFVSIQGICQRNPPIDNGADVGERCGGRRKCRDGLRCGWFYGEGTCVKISGAHEGERCLSWSGCKLGLYCNFDKYHPTCEKLPSQFLNE